MQRVVGIHLNGSVFQVEENGYNALFAYLDSTDARLKDSPDRPQLLADLERTIADKCQALLSPHKTVITTADVAGILAELQPVEGQTGSAAHAASAGGSGSQSSSAGATTGNSAGAGSASGSGESSAGPSIRRLHQVRQGGMIAGVCLGLATYFHVDVTLVRILFALFALATGGWGILAYFGLMFILPRATTVADADAPSIGPHRWPWDDGWPWDKHGWPWDRPDWTAQRQDWRQQRQDWRQQRQQWRSERRAARLAYGPPPIGGTIVIALFVLIAFGWLAFWMRGAWFWGGPIFWGGPFFWGPHHWIGIVFLLIFMRFLLWPLRASRWGWYGHPGYGYHPYGPWAAMWHAIVWLGTVIVLIWIAYQFIPGVHEFIRQLQTGWPNGRFDV